MLLLMFASFIIILFFFNDTATTEIYTLSLHDALPICNLAHRPRCGRHLHLLLAANTWRIPIAPSSFDQDTPRPTIASLGDTAAVDRVSCGAFGGYETEIPHQLAGILKARQIADLGQHRHCRNEI